MKGQWFYKYHSIVIPLPIAAHSTCSLCLACQKATRKVVNIEWGIQRLWNFLRKVFVMSSCDMEAITPWRSEVLQWSKKCLLHWRGCAKVTYDRGTLKTTELLVCLFCTFYPHTCLLTASDLMVWVGLPCSHFSEVHSVFYVSERHYPPQRRTAGSQSAWCSRLLWRSALFLQLVHK